MWGFAFYPERKPENPAFAGFFADQLVGQGRIELPTYGLGNRRSVQLSYYPSKTRKL